MEWLGRYVSPIVSFSDESGLHFVGCSVCNLLRSSEPSRYPISQYEYIIDTANVNLTVFRISIIHDQINNNIINN